MDTTEKDKIDEAFFNNTEVHFVLYDKNLYIINANESLLNFYHIERNQLVGKHITEVAPDVKEKGLYDKYMNVIHTGESIIIEDIVTHTMYGNQHNRIKAFKIGEGLGVSAINITALKNTEDSLESFILKSSHDLRSPLANIRGLAGLVLSERYSPAEILNFCNLIKSQAESMDELIHKLMETIRISKEYHDFQLVKFDELINEVKKSIAFVSGFDKIEFIQNVISSRNFYSDRDNLISLFQNLIGNAIKYRNKNLTNPFVKITVADDILGIKITISDNGIGIPTHLQKDVFKMFFRSTNEKDSTGLGLYSVFHIVRKLNGHITFNSKEMLGTTFTIYLPFEKNKKGEESVDVNVNELMI